VPRHHFVPQFLLSRWANRGRLKAYRWIEARGEVVASSVSVAQACQIEDLHSFFGVPRGKREAPERDFFAPQIDTPAADAHAIMIADDVRALTSEQRIAWSRFLVAFGCRTPETLRLFGPEQYRRAMTHNQATPTESPEVEAAVNSRIAGEMRALERNIPLEIAMEFAGDQDKVLRVAEMHWWLRRFNEDGVLLGDRPLLSAPPANWPCGIAIDDRNCLITLPISPRIVFFASADRSLQVTMRRGNQLLRAINEATIQCVVEYVFAATVSTERFIRKRLQGKTRSIWPLSASRSVSPDIDQSTVRPHDDPESGL
jgi:uncharacterized protein DUF4238